MKVIQSFWSQNKPDVINCSFGWMAPQYNWLSWILSANQLAKYYEVELYTDQKGYEVLIEKLQLPYTKVHVVLDELNHYHSDLWAIPKIKAYSLQQEPFLHVDGDVFIWEPFPEALMGAGLIAQNMESTTLYYKNMWDEIKPKLEYIPTEMDKYVYGINNSACNMGIIGGHDIDFFQTYAATAFEFVDRNQAVWHNINGFNFNIFYEQLLFHEQAMIQNRTVDFLIDGITEDNNYVGFGDFDKVPKQKTYLHLLGVYKTNMRVSKMMEAYVIKEYPQYVERLAKLYPKSYPAFAVGHTFTTVHNRQLMERLMRSIENGSSIIVDTDYLLARDFLALELPQQFDNWRTTGQDCMLVWLPATHVATINEVGQNKGLFVGELDGSFLVSEMDEVDEIIINELAAPKSYRQLMEDLKGYLDDEAIEEFDTFSTMVTNRLRYFITAKALLIYLPSANQQKPNTP
jgi:hypothetical protein